MTHGNILPLCFFFIATAYTIRSLHTIGGEIAARKKALMLSWSFLAAFCWKTVAEYAPGMCLEFSHLHERDAGEFGTSSSAFSFFFFKKM